MTQKERSTRAKRAQSLVDLVSKVEGGYRVQSSRDPSVAYFVSKPNGRVVCTCSDFEKHLEDPRFECKHLLAVREAYRLGKVNGKSQAHIELETQAMFGDPDAIKSLNAGFHVEDPAPEDEIPAEGSQDLDPCMVCGDLLSAPEMIPLDQVQGRHYQGAEGSGLVCTFCHKEILDQAQAEAQKELAQQLQSLPRTRSGDLQTSTGIPEVPRALTLADRIQMANSILEAFGPKALEVVRIPGKNGGREFVGYGLQYTLDAINEALGPENWKYHLLEKSEGGKGIWVLIELKLWDGIRWHSHGPMFGSTSLSDEGDSFKGAIGDALKKSFAYWGIGNRAYRGEIKNGKAA